LRKNGRKIAVIYKKAFVNGHILREQVQIVGHHVEVPSHEEDGDENYYKYI
jgi:hypothetical protein